jgi:hypothetical protein
MAWDRKAYDRQRSRQMYEQYQEQRMKALELHGGKCCCCKNSTAKQLHLHHKYYDENSDYPRTSSGWSRIRRVKEAIEFPEKFALLCGSCHQTIEIAKRFIFQHTTVEHFIELCGLKTHTVSPIESAVGVATATTLKS